MFQSTEKRRPEDKTNYEVVDPMRNHKELHLIIYENKPQELGHIIQGNRYEILRLSIEGKIKRKRSLGIRQDDWRTYANDLNSSQ